MSQTGELGIPGGAGTRGTVRPCLLFFVIYCS